MISIEKIKSKLGQEYSVHYQREMGSTNSWALDKCEKTDEVFLCDKQTKGRGRLGRIWESQAFKDGLMTLVDQSPQKTEKAYQVTLVAGLSLLESLMKSYPDLNLKLKWPNDLICNDKKLAGLLCEIKDKKKLLIIGLGININSKKNDFSTELQDKLTSLFEELKQEVSREDLLISFIKNYKKNRAIYDTSGLKNLINLWNQYDYLQGKKVQIQSNGNPITGIAGGINHEGLLRIDCQGEEKLILSGEILIL